MKGRKDKTPISKIETPVTPDATIGATALAPPEAETVTMIEVSSLPKVTTGATITTPQETKTITTTVITEVEVHMEDTTLPNTETERTTILPPDEPVSPPNETNATALNEDKSTDPQTPESCGDYWVIKPNTKYPGINNGLL